jgi:hypothetical protein
VSGFLQLEERKTSSVAAAEDGPLLEEFRSAFQEVSQWIDSAEAKLLEARCRFYKLQFRPKSFRTKFVE